MTGGGPELHEISFRHRREDITGEDRTALHEISKVPGRQVAWREREKRRSIKVRRNSHPEKNTENEGSIRAVSHQKVFSGGGTGKKTRNPRPGGNKVRQKRVKEEISASGRV